LLYVAEMLPEVEGRFAAQPELSQRL